MITWYMHRRANSWMKKSKAKQITVIQTSRTAVFSSVQSPNSSGRVIIVDIYTTVVKILGKASLIAMPWNGCWTGWKIIFDKNCIPGLLMWKFVRDWPVLLLDFVFFPLHWIGTTRRRISYEITENEWHLLLLFHRRPSDLWRIHFLIRSNAGIMDGNRDLVNQ